jgi:hypothetical protein
MCHGHIPLTLRRTSREFQITSAVIQLKPYVLLLSGLNFSVATGPAWCITELAEEPICSLNVCSVDNKSVAVRTVSQRIAALVLTLGNRWRWVVSFTSRPLYSPTKGHMVRIV